MIFLILSIFASTLTVLFFKIFEIKKVDMLQGIVSNYFLCAVLGNIISDKEAIFTLPFWTFGWFPYTIFLGFLFITIFFAIGKTTQNLGVSVSMVAAKLSVVIPVVFALIIYGEQLNFLKVIGVLISLLAVYFISQKEKPNVSSKAMLWFLPLLVFIGSGIIDTTLNFVQKNFIPEFEAAQIITVVFGVAFVLGSLMMLLSALNGGLKISPRSLIWGVLLGIPNYFSMFFLLKTLERFHGSFIFPINNVGIVAFSTLASVIIFKEQLSRNNVFGLLMASVAIFMISFL